MSLLEELSQGDEPDEYDGLSPSVKEVYSRKEWQWLSDMQKANLSTDEMEPECYDY